MPYKVGKGADGGKAGGRSTGPPKPWDDGARVSSDSGDLMPNDIAFTGGRGSEGERPCRPSNNIGARPRLVKPSPLAPVQCKAVVRLHAPRWPPWGNLGRVGLAR